MKTFLVLASSREEFEIVKSYLAAEDDYKYINNLNDLRGYVNCTFLKTRGWHQNRNYDTNFMRTLYSDRFDL